MTWGMGSLRPRTGEILLVGDFLHPGHDLAVERLLDGDVGHRAGRRRAVPMLVLGRAPDDVAGADLDDRLAVALGPADARGDDQGLAERVAVPGGSRAGLEGDDRARYARRIVPPELRFNADPAR